MAPPPNRQDKPAVVAEFDVRNWLSDQTGVRGWVVDRTYTQGKVEFVASYTARGGPGAKVTLKALTVAANASWELLAEWNGHQAGVVIPARTHIKW